MVATLLDEEVYLCSERTMYRKPRLRGSGLSSMPGRSAPGRGCKLPELMGLDDAVQRVILGDLEAARARRSGAITTDVLSQLIMPPSRAVYVVEAGSPADPENFSLARSDDPAVLPEA